MYPSVHRKQGKFAGESLASGHESQLTGLNFLYELSAPHDATGQATGKRQHKPVTFTKQWGAASPQIFQVLVDNELISSVLFEFVRDNAGVEETYQTLKLTNAAVSALRRHSDEISIDGAAQVSAEFEDVSFVYSHIEVTNIAGGTTRRMTRRFFNRRKAISLTQLF